MANPITQAMITGGGPSAFRITPGDWYFAEPLTYPWGTGIAIQNDAAYDQNKIRIFTQGFPLIAVGDAIGSADGINIIATSVEIYDLKIKNFNNNLQLVTYSTTPNQGGNHVLQNINSYGSRQDSIRIGGPNNVCKDILVFGTGNGSVPYRPIGFESLGSNPTLINISVSEMIKGPNDTETMHYHIQDGGSTGRMLSCHGLQTTKNSGSYGIWFNTTTSMQLEDCYFENVSTAFADDLEGGRIHGPTPVNCDVNTALPVGVIVNFS